MIAVLASASAWADIQAVAGDRRCFLARDEDEFLRLAGDADAAVLEAEHLVLFFPSFDTSIEIIRSCLSFSSPSRTQSTFDTLPPFPSRQFSATTRSPHVSPPPSRVRRKWPSGFKRSERRA